VAPNNRPQLSKEQAAALARKLMGNPLAVLWWSLLLLRRSPPRPSRPSCLSDIR